MAGGYLSKRLKRLSNREVLVILAAMTLLALTLALWSTSAINPLRGDSAEYLYFDPSRPVGYPAFLWLTRLVTGKVVLAVPAQMFLLAGSLLFLGWSFHKSVGRPAISLAFQALVLSQAAMWFAAAFLMTEALSTALVAIWCAQLLRMIKAPSSRGTALLVTIAGLATMVRPSLVALFFATGVFILVVLAGRERGRALIMAAAGLIMAWAATPVAQFIVHGSAKTTSPFARGVLQHTLYCDPETLPRDADSLFVEQNAARVRQYIDSAPADMQEQFRREYSTPLRFGLIIPVVGRRHHVDVRSAVDPYLFRIARERVQANPYCYISSVVAEYGRMATFSADPTSEDGREIRQFMAYHPPVELPQYPVLPGDARMTRNAASDVQNQASGLNPERQRLKVIAKIPFLALLPFRLLFGGAALLGILSLLAFPIRRQLASEVQKMVIAAAAMGVAFHGMLAITAIVEIGAFRYLVPLWPIVCTMDAAALAWLLGAAPRLARTSATAVPQIAEAALAAPTGH